MNELTYCDCKVGKCEGKEHSRCAFIHAKSKGQSLPIDSVSNSALINYIENDAEIAMPINELIHEDGRHLTKKEYGKVLLKYLVKELREHYC